MGISATAIVKDQEILEYIPQRPPIVMVDKFFGEQDNISCSGLTIKGDNIFVENQQLNESGIIEHIAQSCALRVGYICKQQNIPVPIGFIGAIKNMQFLARPSVGEDLYTTVKIEQEVFDITLVSAETKVGDSIIATCEMKIFLKKD